MERRKIIEIYCSNEGDKVALDVEKVENSKEANEIMNNNLISTIGYCSNKKCDKTYCMRHRSNALQTFWWSCDFNSNNEDLCEWFLPFTLEV